MTYFARWKVVLILAICAFGILYTSPNFVSRQATESMPTWLPNKQISLGLDLQGGSYLLLEVEIAEVVKELLETQIDLVRDVLREARIRYRDLGVAGEAGTVTILDAGREGEALDLIRDIDPDFAVEQAEGSRITFRFTEEAISERRASAIEQSIEIVRRRIDETGVREPTIQRQGEDRILLQLPGVDDPERIKRLLGTTAKMTFHLACQEGSVTDAMAGRVPPRCRLARDASEVFTDGSPRMHLLQKRVMMSGESLVNAQPGTDGRTGEPVVTFRLDAAGAKRFGDVTTDNVGRVFAIVLDNEVISAPQIREPILGGSGQISGNFTFQSANDLALLIRAGSLPAPLTILEERTVGPGLGADSIAAGRFASIIGLTLVVVFMIAAYGLFGIMANVALLVNMLLIASVLSVLQATLTLPGIAGIVLTIGMAVDANVLIFERIREEVRNGRTPISAVDAGYARAITTIIDANVTTLIAAVLLFQFGSGPIRGFAVTLSIGIIASMFSAIMLTRLMVVTWLRRTRPNTITI